MFEVKKAQSNSTNVEYVRIDLSEVENHILNNEPSEILNKSYEKDIISKYFFPISPKAEIVLKKFETKKGKKFKGFSVTLNHIAWTTKEGESVYWPSGAEYDMSFKFKKSYNANQFLRGNMGYSNKPVLYIVFDGGFNSENMYTNPYYLSEESFEYIYKKVNKI